MTGPQPSDLLGIEPAGTPARRTTADGSTVASAQVVILGAGPAARHGTLPATTSVGEFGRVFDWLLAAFHGLPGAAITFVGGYRCHDFQDAYPSVRTIHNDRWQTTGPLGSLCAAPAFHDPGPDELWVSYSDIVYRRDLVDRIAERPGPAVLAIDTSWRHRCAGRGASILAASEKVRLTNGRIQVVGRDIPVEEADAEFAGLLRLAPEARELLRSALDAGRLTAQDGIPEAIGELIAQGLPVEIVDVAGDWAELEVPQDLARFVLGTKAESLARLRPLVQRSQIADQISFTLASWWENPGRLCEEVRERFAPRSVIVRSSAICEDGWLASQAGAYDSRLDVDSGSIEALHTAIAEVFDSYPTRDLRHQVLIQPMLEAVTGSGVVLTRTADRGAPYRIVEFDPTAGVTDGVTSGTATELRTFTIHRSASRETLPTALRGVMTAIDEIEELVGHDSLDIEFATTEDEGVHVLQVRPLTPKLEQWHVSDEAIGAAVAAAKEKFSSLAGPRPFVRGSTTVLSGMSDWNPAEIIGAKPRALALSLYRTLVTDEVWARQRAEYGYRDVRPAPLLVELAGHPFVDLRATLTSFLPASISDVIADRRVDLALSKLRAHPALHDKIEFAIIETCFTFDFDRKLAPMSEQEIGEQGFTETELAEIRTAFIEVTRRGIDRCREDLAPLERLETRREQICSAPLPPLERAFQLIEDCRAYGTLPFAHAARAGFVAVSLLKSLVEVDALTTEEAETFLASIETVSGELQRDLAACSEGEFDFDRLIERYGHLRPGTYEITSPNYASAPEYLRPFDPSFAEREGGEAPAANGQGWGEATRARVEQVLTESPLELTLSEFIDFVSTAVAGRERAKFIFTRNLSCALEAIAAFGAEHGVEREVLAHIPWSRFVEWRGASVPDLAARIREESDGGAANYAITQAMCLPGFIAGIADMTEFELARAEPNFVTHAKVRAPIVVLDGETQPAGWDRADGLAGCVVLIPNADPGFDWLFGRGIAGIITLYGGANSHMAIRASEFRLPAAIGVGEALFSRVRTASVIELDCGSRRIEVVV